MRTHFSSAAYKFRVERVSQYGYAVSDRPELFELLITSGNPTGTHIFHGGPTLAVVADQGTPPQSRHYCTGSNTENRRQRQKDLKSDSKSETRSQKFGSCWRSSDDNTLPPPRHRTPYKTKRSITFPCVRVPRNRGRGRKRKKEERKNREGGGKRMRSCQ